jgi:hypothetical protein
LNVVKKISSTIIYFENCIPSQLRENLLYRTRIYYYTTKAHRLNSIVDVEVVTTTVSKILNQVSGISNQVVDRENVNTILEQTEGILFIS